MVSSFSSRTGKAIDALNGTQVQGSLGNRPLILGLTGLLALVTLYANLWPVVDRRVSKRSI